MNKPELIKRIAIAMTLVEIVSTEIKTEMSSYENRGKESEHPDNYEQYIPTAEVFVDDLIKDGVIDAN